MVFEAARGEWSELHTLFRLLTGGEVSLETPQARKGGGRCWPIAVIQREEHDDTRCYYIEGEDIQTEGEKVGKSLPREDFTTMADLILGAIGGSSTDEVASPDGVEKFLDETGIFDLEARTEDRTDSSIASWHPETPLAGLDARPRLGAMNPLLDGGHAASLKLEQSGVKSVASTVNKINALPESPTEVAERMVMIERLGGALKYLDVADRVFRCSLLMVDLHFPRVLVEMVRTMHLGGIIRISELIELMKTVDPLEIEEELISKHGFYEFKVKQFLLAFALGIRPAEVYSGANSTVEGILLVDGSGEVLRYHKSEKRTFEDFLYLSSCLEKGSVDKDKYGFLEGEDGVYYFKLNAKIDLIKR